MGLKKESPSGVIRDPAIPWPPLGTVLWAAFRQLSRSGGPTGLRVSPSESAVNPKVNIHQS